MILKELTLKNFRNYDTLDISLNSGINIIYGDNGSGKTNILESIYVLAFTKSHRSFIDKSLIKNERETAIIKGIIQKDITYNLEIILNKNKKQIKIDNNQITKIGDYIEKMNIIIFYSDDLDLIKGSPSDRRKYLNLELSQISPTYYNTINDYNKLLKIRNDYLKKLMNGEKINQNYFDILTNYIVEKSVFIYQMRHKYIEKLNQICADIFEDITTKQGFNIKYIPSIDITDQTKIKDQMKKTLSENLSKEIKIGSTLYGPHHDDFEFHLKNDNLKYYGSQGQQRIAVLSLKLSEIQILKDYKKTNPIILLDDVFSELDNDKKNNLLKYIDNSNQVIITTTDLENIAEEIIENSKLIKISHGKIIEEVR
ncbi:MAG: DNA replication/repair protein RecF [Bacilli bacterium]|nr:DNA replication/repair protein RecF [Bacilli bacterium]